jgi:hypothetical protein
MQEFIATLLQAVIAAAVPIIGAYIVKLLNTKAATAAAQTDQTRTEKYIFEAADAVATAVACVAQTYTDALKKSGKFAVENQREAFAKAASQAQALLTEDAQRFIETAYGDVMQYLTPKIEAEVLAQKKH